MSAPQVTAATDEAMWHEAENGAYAADLAVWRELCAERAGDVCELGCGTGRVTLDLAEHGHRVCGIEIDPELAAVAADRAQRAGGEARIRCADASDPIAGGPFETILAPMQLMQLLPGPAERGRALEAVADALAPGGRFAAALVEREQIAPAAGPAGEVLPDVRELDGWTYSSMPRAIRITEDSMQIERRRERVSPSGELVGTDHVHELRIISAQALADEAADVGLEVVRTRLIPATDDHVGSTVLVMRTIGGRR